MNDRIIQVEKRSVYGNDLIYPLTHKSEIRALTGQLTLSQRHITALKALGFEVLEVSQIYQY